MEAGRQIDTLREACISELRKKTSQDPMSLQFVRLLLHLPHFNSRLSLTLPVKTSVEKHPLSPCLESWRSLRTASRSIRGRSGDIPATFISQQYRSLSPRPTQESYHSFTGRRSCSSSSKERRPPWTRSQRSPLSRTVLCPKTDLLSPYHSEEIEHQIRQLKHCFSEIFLLHQDTDVLTTDFLHPIT